MPTEEISANSPVPRNSKNLNSRRVEWFAFSVLVAVVFGCLYLFARGIGIGEARLGGSFNHWLDRLILFFVVAVVVSAPALMFLDELNQRAKRPSEERDSLLQFAVHYVPYGILALAMLLEQDKLERGSDEGLAAVASIMVLFALAELGLFIFSHIQKARLISERLETTLQSSHEKLDRLPWADLYSQILQAATISPGKADAMINVQIENLLKEYAAFLDKAGQSDTTRLLTRTFLQEYLQEEIHDFTAELDEDQIPQSVRPPITVPRGKVAYFATNVALYARFLKSAVRKITDIQRVSQTKTEIPYIAVITNALPGQFWNWPVDDRRGQEYRPIAEYLRAQVEAVKSNSLRVFRVILVGADEGAVTTPDLLQRSAEIPILWSRGEWNRQKDWMFAYPIADKNREVPKVIDGSGISEEVLAPHVRWATKAKTDGHPKVYMMFQTMPETLRDSLMFEPVWERYVRELHGPSGLVGKTEIHAVTVEDFLKPYPDGFNSCPDIMFFGVGAEDANDIWQIDHPEGQVKWSLALLSSMSTSTETMFLAFVYDETAVGELWKKVAQAKFRRLTELPLVSSVPK